jgi:ATP-binding cassette subfamily F protein 3
VAKELKSGHYQGSFVSNLLQLKSGIKAYGARALFEDASFAVNAGEKIGVIGPNGAGKSTLFKILIGQESLDRGDITRANGLRVGYLAQEDKWETSQTIEAYLSSQDSTPLWELKQIAPLFGLSLDHFSRELKSLSGGYRMRAKLLHLLASKPDLMMLDEPTNYLDLETLVVLERFLQDSSSAFMLISHDREFLRRTTDHILEIEAGQMTKYAGNIDDYFEQKALLQEQLAKAALTAQAKRKEILDFAAKFGAKATKARQVQSRLKQLQKMEVIEVRGLPTTAKIRLPAAVRTGKVVIQVENATLGYGEKTILRDLRMELGRGDHLGVVGVNGAGKSTLLKALAGELAPKTGKISFGLSVEVAYFAQHVAERLNPDDTVIEAMGAFAHPEVKRQEILDLAGSLLFSGDDIRKKIRILSGGEKSRVSLGQILLKRASCLLLDEPTNHLDFDTVEALTQALAVYAGTVVIVSHDRSFVQRTASKILEIKDGRAEFYPGTYDEYVWSVQKGALSLRGSTGGDASVGLVKESEYTEPSKFNFKERKKQLEKDLRSVEKDMVSFETRSKTNQAKILELNETLLTETGIKAAEAAKQIARLQAEIDDFESHYLECLERHESVGRELELMENRRTE